MMNGTRTIGSGAEEDYGVREFLSSVSGKRSDEIDQVSETVFFVFDPY